ncbi:MAG TPA: conjugal transfer protein [Streptosporangiaceae bacterium]|nr:conjugal transfer protein [Streptosporangiaceae bacterium]
MVRRSAVDRSPHLAEHGLSYEAGTEYAEPEQIGHSRPARTWGGAGGRWLIWAFRGIAWLVLIVIGYRGVVAIVTGETQSAPTSPPPSASPASSFPVTLADAYALQFGQVYLNYSPSSAAQRASQLGVFLPAGSDPRLGWNGTGTSQLQSEQVAGTDVRGAHHAVVTLLARVNGQLMQLGVPIYASSAGLVVSGAPAWLPAPARASLPTATPAASDSATQAILMSQLPGFFQAYASGNQVTLGRFLATGTSLAGLNGAVDYRSIAAVSVPPGGLTRHIIATVVWSVPARGATGQVTKGGGGAAQLQMAYALTVVKQNGTWYVSGISAATESPGPP